MQRCRHSKNDFHETIGAASRCVTFPANPHHSFIFPLSSLSTSQLNQKRRMLRKAAITTAQSVRRRHLPPTALQQLSQLHTRSSLPLHFSNSSSSLHPIPNHDEKSPKKQPPTIALIDIINTTHATHASSSYYYKTQRNQTTLRHYTTRTPAPQRGAAIVLTLASVAATAKAGQYVIQGYNEWKEAREQQQAEAAKEEQIKMKDGEQPGTVDTDETASGTMGEEKTDNKAHTGKEESKTKEGKRENFFAKFFNLSVGSKFYEGEFLIFTITSNFLPLHYPLLKPKPTTHRRIRRTNDPKRSRPHPRCTRILHAQTYQGGTS